MQGSQRQWFGVWGCEEVQDGLSGHVGVKGFRVQGLYSSFSR